MVAEQFKLFLLGFFWAPNFHKLSSIFLLDSFLNLFSQFAQYLYIYFKIWNLIYFFWGGGLLPL
jgi:hypothetical protein